MNNIFAIFYMTMMYVLSVVIGTTAVCVVSIVVGAVPMDMIVYFLMGHWTLFLVLYAVGKGWIGANCGFAA